MPSTDGTVTARLRTPPLEPEDAIFARHIEESYSIYCGLSLKDKVMTKQWAYSQQSSVRAGDYTVEWPGNSVGMLSESQAKMWAANMNEAFDAGRRSVEPRELPEFMVGLIGQDFTPELEAEFRRRVEDAGYVYGGVWKPGEELPQMRTNGDV